MTKKENVEKVKISPENETKISTVVEAKKDSPNLAIKATPRRELRSSTQSVESPEILQKSPIVLSKYKNDLNCDLFEKKFNNWFEVSKNRQL